MISGKNCLKVFSLAIFVLLFASCSGGGGGTPGAGAPPVTPPVVDTTKPTVPANPSATALSTSAISLGWSAATDDTAVTGYKIYRNGTYIKSVTATAATDTALAASTQYHYTVSAFDGAGNESDKSSEVSATTMAVTPPPVVRQVNGIADASVTDGTNLFVATSRSNDAYLTKFDATGSVVWEKPVLVTTDYDECYGIAIISGFVYMTCTQDPLGIGNGVTYLEKLDAATGQKTEVKLSDTSFRLGLVADPATSTLYACYGRNDGTEKIVRLDANGGVLSSVIDSPGGSIGMFMGYMVPSSDAFYSVGTVFQNGISRIKIIKYAKDLSSSVEMQYRDWTVSPQLNDGPSGAVLSPDGSTLWVSGGIDSDPFNPQLANPHNVLLRIDVATGNITATDLGSGLFGFRNIAFDAAGLLYGILETSVAKINATTMVVTPLNINAIGLTVDAANGILFVSDGTDTVSAYDLNGNPL